MIYNDTIVALATPSGAGAIAIIRLSGKDAINLAENQFQSVSGKVLSKQADTYHSFRAYCRWE